jgi:hydroxymethylpyrimidine/phosphomethylpyrimidine kinase
LHEVFSSWIYQALIQQQLMARMGFIMTLILSNNRTLNQVGMPLVNPMTSPEQERRDVLVMLNKASSLLESSMDARLIPPAGTNIVYAIRGARDGRDVAGVKGGIVAVQNHIHLSGPCAFDAGGDISRIVLTAMKFDPCMRSAAVIRFSGKTRAILDDMFIECCALDRTKEPPGTGTMDWGVASCCGEGVPEIIYDTPAAPHEALIRIIGENPVEIAGNIIILSNRIQ